jgi:hypothetical protein
MNTRTKLGAAVALALGGANVHALPLSSYDGTVVNVYVGGATATDNVLENVALAATGGWCLSGSIDIYRAENERVIFCTVDATVVTTITAGTKIAFHKESRGGSSNGVIPLIDVASGAAHSLQWLDLNQLKAEVVSSCGAGTAAGGGTLKAYTNHSSDLPTTGAIEGCLQLLTPADTAGSALRDINWGIADHEPALSYPAPTESGIGKLASRPGVDIIFGVPVSLKLYRALQAAQGKPTDDLPTSIPSLTPAQIRGLYVGFISDWSTITNNAGTPITTATPPASNSVYVCRRVASSGTQSSYESFWLGERCPGFAGASFVTPNDGSGIEDVNYVPVTNPPAGTVNAAPSSGNVRECFLAMDNQNRWAIGTLSTEVTSGNLSGSAFRMVAVNGFAPTLQNVANGSYEFFMTNSLNKVRDPVPPEAPLPGHLDSSDPRRILIEYIENNIGSPSLLALINAPFGPRPWGNGGALAIGGSAAANPAPATAAEMSSNPVNTNTRSPLGATNNCSPPVHFGGSSGPVSTVTLP